VELADELTRFVEEGALFDEPTLRALSTRLVEETVLTGDVIPALLARAFDALVLRVAQGEVPQRVAHDIAGVVYPRLWKVAEAVRDELPDGEVRARVEVLNRGLARRLASEATQAGAHQR